MLQFSWNRSERAGILRPVSSFAVFIAFGICNFGIDSFGGAAAQGPTLPYNHELLDQLKDKSVQTRRDAALAIAKMGADAKGACGELGKLLVDSDAGVRAASAFALGEIGAGAIDTVPTLARGVNTDRDVNVRKECAIAISKIGPKAIKSLSFLISSFRKESDPDARAAVAKALVRVAPQAKETLTMLSDATSDASLEIRKLALETLGEIGPPARPALGAVETATKDSDVTIAEIAKTSQLRINGEIEEPVQNDSIVAAADLPEWKAFSVEDLLAFLKSQTASTRQKAIYQLAKRKNELGQVLKSVLSELGSLLRDDTEPAVRAAAAFAIGEIGQELPELGRGLADEAPIVRIASARAVGRLGRKARLSIRALAQARIRDLTSPVRRAAGEALRFIEKESQDYLRTISDAKEKKAAEVLLQSVLQDSVKAFSDGIQKSDEDVKVRAVLALGELGPAAKDAVPQLTLLLKDNITYVRATAASALADVGADAQKSIAELEKLMNDSDSRVRKHARNAIQRLDPKHPSVAQPKPAVEPPKPAADPKPTDPEPPASAPAPEKPQAPPAEKGSIQAIVNELLDGEGGITEPTGLAEKAEIVTLNLQLAHDRFEAAMAHGDAVKFSIKFFVNIEELQTISINIIAHNGKRIGSYKVTRAKTAPFFERYEDPFERRRIRDWWPQIAERSSN